MIGRSARWPAAAWEPVRPVTELIVPMGGPGDRIADVGRHGNRRLFLEITVTVMRHFREKSII